MNKLEFSEIMNFCRTHRIANRNLRHPILSVEPWLTGAAASQPDEGAEQPHFNRMVFSGGNSDLTGSERFSDSSSLEEQGGTVSRHSSFPESLIVKEP